MKRRTLKQLRSKLQPAGHHSVYVVWLDPLVGKDRKVRTENPDLPACTSENAITRSGSSRRIFSTSAELNPLRRRLWRSPRRRFEVCGGWQNWPKPSDRAGTSVLFSCGERVFSSSGCGRTLRAIEAMV